MTGDEPEVPVSPAGDRLWDELYATIDELEERIRLARTRAKKRADDE